MTDDRSLERAARSFIEVGPTRAPEYAVDAALLRIQTTTQERDWLPWRFPRMSTTARIAALVAIGAITMAGLGLLLGGVGGPSTAPPPASVASPEAIASPTASPAASTRVDYADLPGRILVEHLGNAPDRSEMPTDEANPERRRFYFMDPADMTGATTVEFLPGQPPTGKTAADVSSDGQRVVFNDWAVRPRLYEANLDGSGFRQLPLDCGPCKLLYPDYDPVGGRIVYTRMEGGESWLEIMDLASGDVTPLDATRGPSADAVPEQPAWSPDGASIAFTRLSWPDGADPVMGTIHFGDQPPTGGVLSVLDVATGAVRQLPLASSILPGDANWSPDSQSIVFTSGPASTTGSVSNMPQGGIYRIRTDGTALEALNGWGGARYTPDGQHILYQNNTFWMVRPDGTGDLPVNAGGQDLTELDVGFIYIGHWIESP